MWKPKKIRSDIINNLPHGAQLGISKKVGCTRPLVWQVLHGVAEDHYGIIKEAELIAAINIWKNRFCKFKSEL